MDLKNYLARYWTPRNQRRLALIGSFLTVCAVLFFLFATVPAAVNAQATATPTNTATPTSTFTPTPTALATGVANPVGNGFVQYLVCGSYSYGSITPGACVQIQNGSSIEVFSQAGRRTFYVDGSTGDVTAYGRLAQGPQAIKCVRGEQSVLGSATVIAATPSAAGISTPVYVVASLNADATGKQASVSTTNSAGVVTLKVWDSALTPVAGTTAVAVDYELCGSN